MDTPNELTQQAAQNRNLQAALALTADGIAVFPFRLVPRPGKDPEKKPCITGFKERATTDPAQLTRWWRKWPDAMPGIPTGIRTGFAVLDVDQKNDKDGFAELAKLGLDVDTLSPLQVESPTGGRHLYFRCPEGVGGGAADQFGDGLDFRAEGNYVAAPGAINGKGVYKLLSGSLSAELPEWPDALPIRRKASEPGEARPTTLPFDVILSALAACPNDGDEFKGRDAWLHMGMALHAETGGSEDGRAAFHEWSEPYGDYDPTATDQAWDSFRADRAGGMTGWHVIAQARKRGWRHPTVDAMEAAALDDAWTAKELAEIDRRSAELAKAEWEAEMRRTLDAEGLDWLGLSPSRLTFLSPADCEDLPARRYVLKGLLGEGDIAAIVGAPGAGKSLLAPYLGFAVAQGVKAFGRRTRQGRVFYVAAEDSHGMRARVQALRGQRGDADAFRLVEGVSDLLSEASEDLKALLVAVEDKRPALIVIDTLAAAFPALEENDAKAMGRVVAVARKLTRWGAAVALVHHDTKEGSGLPRGHSILNGALDMSLHLKRDGKVVRVRPSKNRNGSTDQELAFSVGTVQMGTDEDGDPIWTAICDEENAAHLPSPDKPLSPSSRAALDILEELSRGRDSVPRQEWRKACLASDAVCGAESADSRARALRRAIEDLTRRDLIASDRDTIRLTSATAADGVGDDDDD